MPRINIFMCGTKQNILGFINSHPQLIVRNRPNEWEYPRLIVKAYQLYFHIDERHPQVYQLIPDDNHDWRLVCRVIRRLKAAAPPTVKIVSMAWLFVNYPNIAKQIFCPPIYDGQGNITGYDLTKKHYPLTITGDDPSRVIDYDPTQNEIDNDLDPDPADLGIIEEVQP